MAQHKPWNARPAPKPTTITEAARRYHACAQALAATLGLSLAEVLAQHRESVTAVYIDQIRSESAIEKSDLEKTENFRRKLGTSGDAGASPTRPKSIVTPTPGWSSH